MKEFIYTCEHCGTQYTITEPGQYQCQNCNNVFIAEDPEQAQAERLEQIRRKAEEAEASKQAQANTIQYTIQPVKPKRLKGVAGLVLLCFITGICILSFGVHVSLGIQDLCNEKKRNHLESLQMNLEQSSKAYEEDILNKEKRQRFNKDYEEFNKYKKEYGDVKENLQGSELFYIGFILFFCIIFLELYTMIQRIDYNTRIQ